MFPEWKRMIRGDDDGGIVEQTPFLQFVDQVAKVLVGEPQ